MAETAESKSINDLKKQITDQNAKRDAQLERIANSNTRFAERAQELIKADKEKIALQKRVSGLSEKRVEKASLLTQAIEKQKEIMEAQKAKLDEIGVDSSTNKKFQKEELKLAKLEKAQAKATGSADAEDAAKKKIADAKSNTFLGKIAGGIIGLGKKTAEKTKEGAGSIMGMLKKFAFGAFAVAILAFLQSPYFDKFLKVIKEQIVPALTTLIDDYIIPIGKIIWDGIVKTWENIKELFSGLKESFDLFGEGKWSEGIIKFFSSIGTFLVKQIDTISTTLYNAIAAVFGLEKTDSVFGSISKFFSDIGTNIKNFFTDMYDKVINLIGDFAVFKFVEETLGDLFSSIKGIFSGDFSMKNLLKGGKALFDIVYYPINLAVNTIKDIFKLGDPNQPFRLSDFIFGPDGIVTKVINFFKDLFEIDFKALLGGLLGKVGEVGGKIAGILGFGGGGDKKVAKTDTPTGKPDDSLGPMMTEEEFAKSDEYVGSKDDKAGIRAQYRDYQEEYGMMQRARGKSSRVRARQGNRYNYQGGRGSGAGGRYEMKMRARRFREPADPDMVGTLPRSNGNAGRGMAPPSGQQKQAPPIVNAPTTVKGGDSKTVMQMSKTLAPRDRAIDEIGLSI